MQLSSPERPGEGVPPMAAGSGIQRILLVADDQYPPAPTDGGFSSASVIRWGLVQGLRSCGVDVGFYVARPSAPGKRSNRADIVAALGNERLWFDRPGPAPSTESVAALEAALAAFRPDAILVYGYTPLRLVRATTYADLVGVMSIDLEFRPKLHKLAHFLRAGGPLTKLKAVKSAPGILSTAVVTRARVLRDYPLADFVINHAANHADWHRRKHGRATLYAPNPMVAVAEAFPEPVTSTPPRFMLFGGLAGTATLTGLEWFAKGVYPLLERDVQAGRLEIHIAGRRRLLTPLDRLMKAVIWRGYIEDLMAEMRQTTALLVPTPIRLGFRTRILDAFRHGVAVIAHEANAAGMPELENGRNALLAANPRDFAEAVLALAADPGEARRLARAAFDDFSRDLNATAVAGNILRFIGDQARIGAPTAGEALHVASPA
jgi:glycosyltransferase involved in cell wall biosynthesis